MGTRDFKRSKETIMDEDAKTGSRVPDDVLPSRSEMEDDEDRII